MRTRIGGGDSWLLLFRAMKELRANWPSRGWSWDSRLSCVTSSFITELEGKARAASSIALPSEWTANTIQQAPAALRELAERTGGLRTGQMIFASTAFGSALAYGLWWPWGDGMTTSVRIGLLETAVMEDALQRLREVFNVEV